VPVTPPQNAKISVWFDVESVSDKLDALVPAAMNELLGVNISEVKGALVPLTERDQALYVPVSAL
jgi:hypothetical protein